MLASSTANPMLQNSATGVKELSDSCNSFLTNFDSWLAARKMNITKELSAFQLAQVEFKTQKARLSTQLEGKQIELNQLQAQHSNITQEIGERSLKLQELDGKDQDLQGRIIALARDHEKLKRDLHMRRQAYTTKTEEYESKKKIQGPALKFYEDMFAMRIETIEVNYLRIIYTCIDEKDSAREFFFEIKIVSDNSIKVPRCEPKLPQLDDILSQYRDNQEFSDLLKQMRAAFVHQCSNN